METKKPTIDEVLTRQVQEILPGKDELAKVMQEKKIRLYFGVDPTAPNLHLGHVVPLRKLKQFQELGHEVILLFGTFTAQVGDPSGKDKMRQPLSENEIQKNLESYKKQAEKILDFSKVKIKFNADWLKKLNFKDILKLASHMTVARLLERDMFQERIKKGDEIWAHELLYPLMQGYDSVAMNVDLEMGGNDQLFNMLVGRKLQKDYNNKEKFVLATPLLLGLDGRKMSKTYGNTVDIFDEPNDMYGKIMTLKDDLIGHYFELCTDVSAKEFEGLSSRDAKARLAKTIVALYHGEKAAQAAEDEFNHVFREGMQPEEIPEARLSILANKKNEDAPQPQVQIIDLLIEVGLAPSKSEARRLIEQGGIKIDNVVQNNIAQNIAVKKGMVVQAGKRRFVRLA